MGAGVTKSMLVGFRDAAVMDHLVSQVLVINQDIGGRFHIGLEEILNSQTKQV